MIQEPDAGPRPGRLVCLGLIITAGIVLRLHDYLLNHPLWWDECNSALNIVGRSLKELLEPLDFNQAAPLGFLAGTRLAVRLLGNNEYALRLLPLLAGILSVPLFYILLRRCLAPGIIWLPLALLALSPRLVFYSTEVKQYALDLLLAITFMLAARPASAAASRPAHTVTLTIAGALAIWFSHPVVFVLAGVIAYRTLRDPTDHEAHRARGLITIASIWAMSFGLTYLLSLRELIGRHDMHAFWRAGSSLPGAPPGGAFLPLPPTAWDGPVWLARVFFEFFERPMGLHFAGLAALLVIIGFLSLARRNRALLALLLVPAVCALAASALQVYPFRYRLILFLVPAALVLLGRGAQTVHDLTAGSKLPVAAIIAILLLVEPVGFSLQRVGSGPLASRTRTVLATLVNELRDDDVVYVDYGAERPWQYYAPRLGLVPRTLFIGSQPEPGPGRLLVDLPALRGHSRVWVFLRHEAPAERALILGQLERWGRRLRRIEGDGERLYLFDFTPADLTSHLPR